jgi:acetyltransferase-like isoleucine patch superfamily enzyme
MRPRNYFNRLANSAKYYFSKRLIHNSTLDPTSIIGKRVKIFDSTRMSDSIIESDVSISRSILKNFIRVSSNCIISDCAIDDYSYISRSSWFSLTEIGKFCSIGARITCGRGNHPSEFISNHPIFYSPRKQCATSFASRSHFEERIKIIIKNDVWIGDNVFIKDGIAIGNGAIIAAGSVVVNDIPDYAIAGGVPAKIIKYKFDRKIIEQLLELEWWNWNEPALQSTQNLFIEDNIEKAMELLNSIATKEKDG